MREMKADVAVIAGGPSGLCAATAAAENGASVIVFEKSGTTGGAANMGMGPLGLGSRMQRSKLIGIDADQAFELIMNYTHWRVDANLVRRYFDKSADTINWLEDMGVEFWDVKPYFAGAEYTWHIVKPESGPPGARCASNMYRIVTQHAKEIGVDFQMETKVTKILRENGEIKGIIAVDKNGEEIRCEAKAVCVCTGGFGDSPEMVKEYTGYEMGKDFFPIRVPGLYGEGMKMAWEVGAGKSDIGVEMIFHPASQMQYPLLGRLFSQPCLLVNKQGERFFNEGLMGNTTFTGNALSIQQGRVGFVCMDNSIKRLYEREGFDFVTFVQPNSDASAASEELERAQKDGDPYIFQADTLEELAEKMGVDVENFVNTVEEYNEMCVSADTVFNKPRKYMRPLKKAPFYAGAVFPAAYGSLGGIKINYKTEVLTQDWEKVPGLFAAGTDTCTIYGDSYCFLLPGNTMGYAINSGRMAGEAAADFVNQL